MNEIIQKMKVSDYVFEIDEKNIYNCVIKYSITENMPVYYNDGRLESIYNPVINFEIQGWDLDKNNAWICFELNIGLKELNEYSSMPTNIIDKVSMSESFIKRPNEENSTFLDFEIPRNMVDDMYKNISSVWVSKLDVNIFIFKVCIPGERVFSYFIVDFNKK